MKGLLINYEYCTGCHSCEVACRNELGLGHGEFGIKLTEVGPWEFAQPIPGTKTPYEWVYNPTITKACNMCEQRTALGKMPACVQACQAWCMYYGEVAELVEKMDGRSRWVLYTALDHDRLQAEMDAEDPDYFFPKVDVREADAAAWQAAHGGAGEGGADAQAEPLNVDGNTVVNLIINGEDKLAAFVAEHGAEGFDLATAREDVRTQFVANSATTRYVLSAVYSADGQPHELPLQGIAMQYDEQGTQLGGGKAYLDKGQPVARVDIVINF